MVSWAEGNSAMLKREILLPWREAAIAFQGNVTFFSGHGDSFKGHFVWIYSVRLMHAPVHCLMYAPVHRLMRAPVHRLMHALVHISFLSLSNIHRTSLVAEA